MASPTLLAYKGLHPEDQRPDYQIAQSLAAQLQNEGSLSQFPDLTEELGRLEKQDRISNPPGLADEFLSAIGSGTDVAQAQLYSTAGQIGDLIGSDTIKNWGLEGYRENMESARDYVPTAPSYQDVIENPSLALRYGLTQVGQNVPQFAGTLAAEVAGRAATSAIGSAVGPEGALAGAAWGPAAFRAARGLAQWAPEISAYTQTQNYGDLANDPNAENPAMTAAIVGAISAKLETYVPHKMASKWFPGDTRLDMSAWIPQVINMTDKPFQQALLKAAAENTISEGLTEVAQEATSVAGEMFANRNNPNYVLDPAAVRKRLMEAGIAGGLVGGVMSPIEGVGDYLGQKKEADETQSDLVPSTSPDIPLPNVPDVIKQTTRPVLPTPAAPVPETPVIRPAPHITDTEDKIGNIYAGVDNIQTPFDDFLKANEDKNWTEVTWKQDESGNTKPVFTEEKPAAPVKPAAPKALVPSGGELPVLSAVADSIKEGSSPNDVAVIAREGNREDKTFKKGDSKKLVALLDRETNTVSVASAYRATADDEYRVFFGKGTLPSNQDVADRLDVSVSTVRNALAGRLNSEMAVKIRDYVASLGTGLKAKDPMLKELLSETMSDGSPRYQALHSMTMESPISGFRVMFPDRASYEAALGKAESVSKAKIAHAENIAAAREGRADIYMNRVKELDPTGNTERALRSLSSILENELTRNVKVKDKAGNEENLGQNLGGLEITPDANAMQLGLFRLVKGDTLSRFLSRVTKAEDLLGKAKIGKGKDKILGIFTNTQWQDFVEAVQSDPELAISTLSDILEENGKSLRWFAKQVAAKGSAAQTHYSQVMENLDAPSESIVQDPEEVVSDAASADPTSQEDQFHEPDPNTPSEVVPVTGLSNKESMAIKGLWARRDLDSFEKMRNQRGVVEPEAHWSLDEGFVKIRPMLDDIVRKVMAASRAKIVKDAEGNVHPVTTHMTDEELYKLYVNSPVMLRDSQGRVASYRESSANIRSTFYKIVQALSQRGVDIRVAEQDINSASDVIRNEWGRVAAYENGKRLILLSVNDLQNPTKENLRKLLHEAGHLVMWGQPQWVQNALHDAIERSAAFTQDLLAKVDDPRYAEMQGRELFEELLMDHLAFVGLDKQASKGLLDKIINYVTDIMNRAAMMYYKWRNIQVPPSVAISYMENRFQDFLEGKMQSRMTLDKVMGQEFLPSWHQAQFYKQVGSNVELERWDPSSGNIVPVRVIEDTESATLFNLDLINSKYDQAETGNASFPDKSAYSQGYASNEQANSPEVENARWQSLLTQRYGINTRFEATAADVLTKLAKMTRPGEIAPQVQEIARVLRNHPLARLTRVSIASKENIGMLRVRKDNGKMGTSAGSFEPGYNHRILISPLHPDIQEGTSLTKVSDELMVHEILHAMTANILDMAEEIINDPSGTLLQESMESEKVPALTGQQIQWIKDHAVPLYRKFESLMATAIENAENPNQYGFSNVHEFISEAMSNPDFQNELANIGGTEEGKPSLLQRFFALVKTLLGFGDYDTMLHSTISNVDKLLNVTGSEQGSTLAAAYSKYRTSLGGQRMLFSNVFSAENQETAREQLRHDLEFEGAVINSQIQVLKELYQRNADQLQIPLDKYVTNILGLKDPWKQREMWLVSVHNRTIPVNISENVSAFPETKKDALKSELVRKQVLREVYFNLERMSNKIAVSTGDAKTSLARTEKKLERAQESARKLDEYLNNISILKEDVLRELHQAVRDVGSDLGRVLDVNEKLTSLGSVLQNMLLKGATQLPEFYKNIFERLLTESGQGFMITDALTGLSKLDIDWRNTPPAEIYEQIKTAYAKNQDPMLKSVVGTDDQSKAAAAISIYYAKSNPRIMATLALRIEKVASDKVEAIRSIESLISGTAPDIQRIDEMVKSGINQTNIIARVKVEFRQAQNQFKRLQRQVELLKKRTAENEYATEAMRQKISEIQPVLGIRAEVFNPYHGAPVIRTPDARAGSLTLKTEPLDLQSKNYTKKLMEIWLENKKWVEVNKNFQDATFEAVKEQLAALERMMGDEAIRHIKDFGVSRALQSIPQRLRNVGLPGARAVAKRWDDFFAKRFSKEAANAQAYEIVKTWSAAVKASGLSADVFTRLFWNPSNYYTETSRYLLTNDAARNEQRVKEGLKKYLMQNPTVSKVMLAHPDFFDKLWSALKMNYEKGSKFAANFAQKNGVFVEEEGETISNPRGRFNAKGERIELKSALFRPHMEVGHTTSQRSVKNLAPVVRLLDSTWAPLLVPDTKEELTPETYTKYFTPEVIRLFAVPYINHINFQHFPSPTMPDGVVRFKVPYATVQEAWHSAGGDIMKFADFMFASERGITLEEAAKNAELKEYRQLILDTFKSKFKLMKNLLLKSEHTVVTPGYDSLPHQLMDARQSESLPPDFLEYVLYTPITLHIIMEQLAATSAFGRDLGVAQNVRQPNKGLMWEYMNLIKDMQESTAEADKRRALLRAANPLATQKEVERALEKEIGHDEYARITNLPSKINEVKTIVDATYLYFRHPNGDTKDFGAGMEFVRLLAGMMVSNFKTALYQTMSLFDHLFGLRLNKTGMTTVGRSWSSFFETGYMTMAEALGKQMARTNESAQWLAKFRELGIFQDLGNLTDVESVLADPGHNYNYLTDQKILGWMRKGKSAYFNMGFKVRSGAKIRPLAPFGTINLDVNIATAVGSMQLYREVLQTAADYFQNGNMMKDFLDPSFMFKSSHFKNISPDAFEQMRSQLEEMGTTLEIAARRSTEQILAGKTGVSIVPDDLAIKIAAKTMQNVTLQSDITTAPAWIFTNPFGKVTAPLLTWPIARVGQLIRAAGDAKGEISVRSLGAFAALLAFGIVPAGIAMSLLMDKYDEDILGKKSNLISFSPSAGMSQNLSALVERLGRTGTFGLAGDVVNGVRVYGSEGDLRGLSFDQRVLFANSLLSTLGLFSTIMHQKGTVTYSTFWRPMINTLGGNGYLQNAQILNKMATNFAGTPVFEAEARVTARINAQNYLRAAGRVLNMDVRTGSGMPALPTPVRPWISEMTLAAYANDSITFYAAYNRAIEAARKDGHPDPEEYVKRAFQSSHPLRTVYKTPPTNGDYQRILSTVGSEGRKDVMEAVQYFNAYLEAIGGKAYNGSNERKPLQSSVKPVSIF